METPAARATASAAGAPTATPGERLGHLVNFGRENPWWTALLLAGITLLAYGPALTGGFVWDDDSWTSLIQPVLRDAAGLRAIWFTPTALQQYYPLTGTTFWIDYHLWGFHTLPYHLENILLHVLAAVLFGRLLQRLRVPGAWLAAAIFALHPVMVESAAWITERKNVLSLALVLAALLAYGRFAGYWETETKPEKRAWNAYGWAALLFLAALLAKTTVFALPAVVLVIAWWKRGTLRWSADIVPAIPFFLLGAALSGVTAWLETHHVGARGGDWSINFPERCQVAGRALWFYAGKLVAPVNLCFVYPRWHPDVHSLVQWIYPVTAAGGLLVLWLLRSRIGRGPAAAAFIFAGTLFPVLGFMNAYGARYSFVWDHWVYLSSLAPIALIAAAIVRATERLRVSALLPEITAVVVVCLAGLTWRQSRQFTDSQTLWETTIARNPQAFLAHNNLGLDLVHAGKPDKGMEHFYRALEADPRNAEAHDNLGSVLMHSGRLDEATNQFNAALASEPDDATACNNLGAVCLIRGEMDQAAVYFNQALGFQPNYAEAYNNLGMALLHAGNLDEAVVHLQRALAIQPGYPQACLNLARVAWVLATCPEASLRNGTRAVDLASQADRSSGGGNPEIAQALAAAYAETGRFPDALKTAGRALQLASAESDAELANGIRNQLAVYQAGRAWRDADGPRP